VFIRYVIPELYFINEPLALNLIGFDPKAGNAQPATQALN
jgi:hypothetical protein